MFDRALICGSRSGSRSVCLALKLVYRFRGCRIEDQRVHVPQSSVAHEQGDHQQWHEERRPTSDGGHARVENDILASLEHHGTNFILCSTGRRDRGPLPGRRVRKSIGSDTFQPETGVSPGFHAAIQIRNIRVAEAYQSLGGIEAHGSALAVEYDLRVFIRR